MPAAAAALGFAAAGDDAAGLGTAEAAADGAEEAGAVLAAACELEAGGAAVGELGADWPPQAASANRAIATIENQR